MKQIIIVGAGGFGREVFGYAEDCIRAGAAWEIKGFLDDNPRALDGLDYPCGLLGGIAAYQPRQGDYFLMGLGLPKAKKAVAGQLLARGAAFETLIHPTARVGRNVRVGAGCVLCLHTNFTCDISLGDFVTVNCHSGCGHDARLGSWTTLSSYCDVTGHVQLGEGVFFASSVKTVPSSKVGDWASVGINSSVIMNVKAGASVFGNPAVRIR